MSRCNAPIPKNDYEEPQCLLINEVDHIPENIRPIPQQRVIAKMDDYMSRRDYDGAERHLLYWLGEAKAGQDLRGELLVRNELVGHYRKVSNREAAFQSAEEALRLVKTLDYDGSISSGTTYTNVATMYNAFGENEKALHYFEKAKAVYEASPATGAELLGGLYNNMALVNVALKRYQTARTLYEQALDAMGKAPYGELEQAITYLNMANALEDELGPEEAEGKIFDLLDQALALLDTEGIPHGGYYAFVCEKCYPTFAYYGYFSDAERLKQLSETIYKQRNEE